MQNFRNAIQDIIADKSSGSSQILEKTISAILAYIQGNNEINTKLLSAELLNLFEKHGNFAILFHFLNQIFLELENNTDAENLHNFLLNYLDKWKGSQKRAAKHLATILEWEKLDAILLHSNSSAIQAFCEELIRQNKFPVIYQTLSGPANEGKVQAAKSLMKRFEIRFIHENAVARFLPDIDLALYGADFICHDLFINKTGTYPLALLFREFKKPVFVLAESRKVILESSVPESIFKKLAMEEKKDPDELWKAPPRNVKPLNYYFERIPKKLVDKFIGEDGELALGNNSTLINLAKSFIKLG